jgi:PAS domain S-box-containing protein
MTKPVRTDIEDFLEALPIPGFIFDLDSRRMLASNRDFQQLMGYSAEELVSMRLDDLRPAQDIPLMETLATGQPESVIRRRYRTKDSRLIWVSLKYRNMRYIANDGQMLEVRFTVVADSQPLVQGLFKGGFEG